MQVPAHQVREEDVQALESVPLRPVRLARDREISGERQGGSEVQAGGKVDRSRDRMGSLRQLRGHDAVELGVARQPLLEGCAPLVVHLDLAAVGGAE